MVAHRITREIDIEAPLEAVWKLVSQPEHVSRWFSDSAEIDLRPGGRMTLTWKDHGVYSAQVERVEPPHHFAFRWLRRCPSDPGPGNSTLVEFQLSEHGGGTTLRVTESGFDELEWPDAERDRYAGENEAGWARELDELVAYVASVGSPAA